MQLILNAENLRFAWGSTTEYWFSRTNYSIVSNTELPVDDQSKLIELGYIPFITVSNEEVIRAYIKSLDNPKLSLKFDGISGEECIEKFWKIFNAYKDVSSGFDEFENNYVKNKVVNWCEENAVNYTIA